MTTINQVIEAVKTIKDFVNPNQLEILGDNCRGEEAEFFKTMIVELAERINNMPKTGETDGQGDDAIVYLHYFVGAADWHITEKDMEAEQLQAFGLADLGWGFPELGYISIEEILANNIELDLYWTPKTLAEVKA